jgi:hypothetical protein
MGSRPSLPAQLSKHPLLAERATAFNHRARPILPDGQSAHANHAQFARRANMPHAMALAASGKSEAPFRASRGLEEGRFAIVTNVGSGMRWTRPRVRRSSRLRYGEVVWSWRSNAGVKVVKTLPASHGRRWQPSMVTGESTKDTVKTIAQGRRMFG